MKKLLLVVLSTVPLVSTAQDTLSESLVVRWQTGSTYLLGLAEAMPADKYDFRPVDSVMSFGEQLKHILLSNTYQASLLDGSRPPQMLLDNLRGAPTDKQTLMPLVRDSFGYAESQLALLGDANLSELVDLWGQDVPKLTVANMLSDHTSHHRGQLVVYLRLQGIKPPPYQPF